MNDNDLSAGGKIGLVSNDRDYVPPPPHPRRAELEAEQKNHRNPATTTRQPPIPPSPQRIAALRAIAELGYTATTTEIATHLAASGRVVDSTKALSNAIYNAKTKHDPPLIATRKKMHSLTPAGVEWLKRQGVETKPAEATPAPISCAPEKPGHIGIDQAVKRLATRLAGPQLPPEAEQIVYSLRQIAKLLAGADADSVLTGAVLSAAQWIDDARKAQASGARLWADEKELYRHNNTGAVYEVICNAYHKATGELMVVYRNTATGGRSARPVDEFNDGRFSRLLRGQ